MSFLNKNKELRVTEASIDSVNKISEEIEAHIRQETEPATKQNNNKGANKRKKPDVERALMDFMESQKTKKPLEEDEDVAFFYSVLPTIRTLNIDQKFNFRFQTMQLLQN